MNEPTPRQEQTTVLAISYIEDLVREFLTQSGYEPRTGAEKYEPMMGLLLRHPLTPISAHLSTSAADDFRQT